MARSLWLTLAVVLLTAPQAAGEETQAGAGDPTRTLESAFTASLTARIESDDACYPDPDELVTKIRERGIDAAEVEEETDAGEGPVYVVRDATRCNNVRLALRDKGRLFVLDSTRGEVSIAGRDPEPEAAIRNRGPLRDVTVSGTSWRASPPNDRLRFEARCPGRTLPLGGGLIQSGVGADGEAFYPYSSERLGAQSGWHITGWLLDRHGRNARRTVTVQAVCGLGLAPTTAPHATDFVEPGESETVTATCQRGQYLMSGGYQRTDFLRDGGNYVTESRAISSSAWRVSGHAYGGYGGELTAIAYSTDAPGPLLSEVSSSTTVSHGAPARATTPPCPAGTELTLGGFSANGSETPFFAGGTINRDASWSASAYGYFGATPRFTAYGYCLRPGSEVAVAANRERVREALDAVIRGF